MSKFSKVAAILIAASYFPNYPQVSEFHITEDEQVFEDLNNATNHARSLSKEELVFTVSREEAEAGATAEEQKPEPTMHIVTAEDLEANPELVEKGVKVGDEIELPAKEEVKQLTAAEKRAATNAAKKAAEAKA